MKICSGVKEIYVGNQIRWLSSSYGLFMFGLSSEIEREKRKNYFHISKIYLKDLKTWQFEF